MFLFQRTRRPNHHSPGKERKRESVYQVIGVGSVGTDSDIAEYRQQLL